MENKFEDQIKELAIKRFGPKFSFREGQLEVICDILDTFFAGEINLYLLQAPVGSGKSVIALIVSDFINNHRLKGYILTSDLMLFDQYVRDIDLYFPQFAYVKGADNYECEINKEKFSLGECRLKNTSYEKAQTLPCFSSCGYFSNRKRAIASNTTLLTYAMHLIQLNYVKPKMEEANKGVPFNTRDFTICDEAHKLTEIVQNHFSPKIDEKALDKLEKLRSVLMKNNLKIPIYTASRVRTVISNLFTEEDPQKLFALLKEHEMQMADYERAGNSIKELVSSKYPGELEVPREWRYNLGLVDWVKDVHCKFEDYNHIITQTGINTMIKNVQGESVVFNCLDETYMMNKHFHSQCGFKLLMTATMGDPSVFLKTIGGTNARFKSMDSTFDFEKSPIYFYPQKKMSMAHKETTLPWMVKKISEILDTHSTEKGIIHTGSYDIAHKLFEMLPPQHKKRMIVYKGTQEKEVSLREFMNSKTGVMMGPSLTTGLDLKDDLSRFALIVKIPYPSLGDAFVRAKTNLDSEWYQQKTIIDILQGVGRTVRNESDWCVTYILDGCFKDILRTNRSAFSRDFLNRIKLQTV